MGHRITTDWGELALVDLLCVTFSHSSTQTHLEFVHEKLARIDREEWTAACVMKNSNLNKPTTPISELQESEVLLVSPNAFPLHGSLSASCPSSEAGLPLTCSKGPSLMMQLMTAPPFSEPTLPTLSSSIIFGILPIYTLLCSHIVLFSRCFMRRNSLSLTGPIVPLGQHLWLIILCLQLSGTYC